MAAKEVMSVKTDGDVKHAVDDYADGRGVSRNKALDDLIRTGLRERRGPVRSRWRNQIHDWAGLLAIAAMVTLAAGVVVPTALSVAVSLAATMLAFSLSLVGIVEGARLLAGQSCLASRMLEEVRR